MIEYIEKKPSLEEFKKLRDSVGWNLEEKGISDERAARSLERSPYCICAYDGDEIIGMVRLLGDLSMYGYIQDSIVIPEHQREGIGSNMMKMLLDRVKSLGGYLIGVCPSKLAVKFYESCGFKKREGPNQFMSLEIK